MASVFGYKLVVFGSYVGNYSFKFSVVTALDSIYLIELHMYISQLRPKAISHTCFVLF